MICLWGNTNPTQVQKVQVVLNIAGRLVSGLDKYTKQSEIMSSCGWMNVKNITRYHSLCQMMKILKFEAPRSIRDKITLTDDKKISTSQPRLTTTSKLFQMGNY